MAYYGEYNEDLIFLCFFWTDCEQNNSKLNLSESYCKLPWSWFRCKFFDLNRYFKDISDDKEFYLSHFMIATNTGKSFCQQKTNCFVLARYVSFDNFAVAKLDRKTEGKVCYL